MAQEEEDFVDKYLRFKRTLGAAMAFLVFGMTCLFFGLGEAANLSKPLKQFSVLLKFALVSAGAISISTFFHAITNYYKNGTPIKYEEYIYVDSKPLKHIAWALIILAFLFLPYIFSKIFNFDLFSEQAIEANLFINLVLMPLLTIEHAYSYWKPLIRTEKSNLN